MRSRRMKRRRKDEWIMKELDCPAPLARATEVPANTVKPPHLLYLTQPNPTIVSTSSPSCVSAMTPRFETPPSSARVVDFCNFRLIEILGVEGDSNMKSENAAGEYQARHQKQSREPFSNII
eukprot:scaffold61_cov180-Ochromonas_danica.AAC.26